MNRNLPSLPIEWSPRSRRDLERIQAYISQFAPLAAQRFTTQLIATVDSLGDYPERGRRHGAELRELAVIKPYLIRYRVTDEAVQIVTIRHGAQRPD